MEARYDERHVVKNLQAAVHILKEAILREKGTSWDRETARQLGHRDVYERLRDKAVKVHKGRVELEQLLAEWGACMPDMAATVQTAVQ